MRQRVARTNSAFGGKADIQSKAESNGMTLSGHQCRLINSRSLSWKRIAPLDQLARIRKLRFSNRNSSSNIASTLTADHRHSGMNPIEFTPGRKSRNSRRMPCAVEEDMAVEDATKVLVPEAFQELRAHIYADTLRDRLPATLVVAEQREREIYGVTDDTGSIASCAATTTSSSCARRRKLRQASPASL
jgi:hypothetical protein